jgi:SH3 domain protein
MPVAHADPVYVIEQLVVAVESTPDADAERVAQVKSGDKLELLEREGEEAHVRLANGKEGWIKASYVSTAEPLQLKLTERAAELEKVKQEGDKLRQDVNRLESELASSKRAAAAVAASAVPASTAPVSTPAASPAANARTTTATSVTCTEATTSGCSSPAPLHETVFLRQPDRPVQTSWLLLLGVAAVMLLVGFVLGWTTLDRRIRQKYGGLRIY